MPDQDPPNPYAPPLDADPSSAPPGRNWSVASGVLQIRNTAAIPRIDLSGHGDTDLIPVLQGQPQAGGSAFLKAIFFTIIMAVLFMRAMPSQASTRLVLIAFTIMAMTRVFRKSTTQPLQFKYYLSRSHASARSQRFFWVRWLGLLAMCCILFFAFRDFRHSRQFLGLIFLALVSFLLPLSIAQARSRPRMGKPDGGWAPMNGVDADTLETLRELEKHPLPEPPTRMARACPAYVYRFPLRCLANRYWFNPLVLIIMLLRCLTSRKVSINLSHESESEILPPDSLPAALRSLTDPWLSNGQGETWHVSRFRRLEPPAGNFLAEIVELSSADLSHRLVLWHTSQIFGLRMMRFSIWAFYTRLQNGTFVKTSTKPPLCKQPEIETHTHRISSQALWKKHLSHLHNRPIRPAESDEQWDEWLHELAEAAHLANQAAGYEGPMTEVPVPLS